MDLGKSGFTLLIERLRADDESGAKVPGEVVDAMLPRKASKLQIVRNRTVNRHR